MRKKIEWQWEKLDGNTLRAKVIGGWIVRCIGGLLKTEVTSVKDAKSLPMSESMVFVPDRDHEWVIAPVFNPSDAGKPQTPKVNAADFESPKA
jgi:hypothetical protein